MLEDSVFFLCRGHIDQVVLKPAYWNLRPGPATRTSRSLNFKVHRCRSLHTMTMEYVLNTGDVSVIKRRRAVDVWRIKAPREKQAIKCHICKLIVVKKSNKALLGHIIVFYKVSETDINPVTTHQNSFSLNYCFGHH